MNEEERVGKQNWREGILEENRMDQKNGKCNCSTAAMLKLLRKGRPYELIGFCSYVILFCKFMSNNYTNIVFGRVRNTGSSSLHFTHSHGRLSGESMLFRLTVRPGCHSLSSCLLELLDEIWAGKAVHWLPCGQRERLTFPLKIMNYDVLFATLRRSHQFIL